ncbi:hypothetical protein QTH90_28850 [Variovorax sp. J2P1-59]|uniref:hypothetical protein n=1 Tax=Variovorax flavidus TaxID=3053501 RepID=UPI0025762A2F|nr:hypothetical protein [Variovorax sp. J2P1-59]MDM0078447.1 hypothetical protein [Variovorax sp. J2P1-59]
MTTRQTKSAASSSAASHSRFLRWAIHAGNVVVILLGMFCAYSLATSHHRWTETPPALWDGVYQTDDAGDTDGADDGAPVCRIAVNA